MTLDFISTKKRFYSVLAVFLITFILPATLTAAPLVEMYSRPNLTLSEEPLDGENVVLNEEIPIKGTILSPKGGGKHPAIIFLHGFDSVANTYHKLIEELVDNGFVVLAYDARGHGRSGGEPDFIKMIDDAVDAIDYLTQREEVDNSRLGMAGHSMGAMVTLLASARDERVKTVAVWSAPCGLSIANEVPFWRGAALIGLPISEHVLPKIISFKHAHVSDPSVFERIIQKAEMLDTSKAASEISPRSILIVQGREDFLVKPYNAPKISEGNENCEVYWIPDTDHSFRGDGGSLAVNRTVRWFKSHLVENDG